MMCGSIYIFFQRKEEKADEKKARNKGELNNFFYKNIDVFPCFGVILYCTFSEHLY